MDEHPLERNEAMNSETATLHSETFEYPASGSQRWFLDQAQSLANVGSWYVDIETGDMAWSDEVYRIFDRPVGTEISYEEFREALHPADRQRVIECWRDAQDGEHYEVEHRIQVDGKTKWVAHKADFSIDDSGDPIAGMGVIQDITERREREQLLRVTDRLLRHNLRNDITVIRGNAATIREERDDAAMDSAETIVEMSDGLLRMGRKARTIHEVVKQDIDRVEVDLGTVLADQVETVQAEFPDAQVILDLSTRPTVIAIPHIETAIGELLRNAVVHNDREHPQVTVTVATDGEDLAVRIADDGPGIPEIERTIVTRDRTIDPVHHGSGLGLWMVHWIVHRSRGTMDLEERQPRGSLATITLDGPHLETDE